MLAAYRADDVERRNLELHVSLSLFASRVEEMESVLRVGGSYPGLVCCRQPLTTMFPFKPPTGKQGSVRDHAAQAERGPGHVSSLAKRDGDCIERAQGDPALEGAAEDVPLCRDGQGERGTLVRKLFHREYYC